MKRFKLYASIFLVLLLFSSCSVTTIPNSAEAEEKLKDLGYSVKISVQYGEEAAAEQIQQVTILNADNGDDFIQVYFFANEKDTDTFFFAHSGFLTRDVEIAKKNKYSIYRGTEKAVSDFLS